MVSMFQCETGFRITVVGLRRGGLSCDQKTEVTGRILIFGLRLVENAEFLETVGQKNTAEMLETSGQDASLCRKIKNGSNESALNAST